MRVNWKERLSKNQFDFTVRKDERFLLSLLNSVSLFHSFYSVSFTGLFITSVCAFFPFPLLLSPACKKDDFSLTHLSLFNLFSYFLSFFLSLGKAFLSPLLACLLAGFLACWLSCLLSHSFTLMNLKD